MSNIMSVQMDALAALKIIRHCQDSLPRLAAGQLLGMDVEGLSEVTNTFAFPAEVKEDEDTLLANKYQRHQRQSSLNQMLGIENRGATSSPALDAFVSKSLHFLKLVNADANVVGWYTTSIIGANLTQSILTQYEMQTHNPNAVLIVYDPLRSRNGSVCLRALQLSSVFMAAFAAKSFTADNLLDSGLSFREIYTELPISIYNSPLVNAFLLEMGDTFQDVSATSFDSLNLESAVFLEKNMQYLLKAIDTLNTGQNNYIYLKNRIAARDEALKRRRADNEARKRDGKPAIPETDIYKRYGASLPDVSSRFEALLASSNVDNYCLQLNSFVEQAFSRVYASDALQE